MQTVKLHPQLNLVYTEDSEGNLDPRFSSPESYKNNRKALYKALNISSHQIIEAQQIHSARILKLTEDNTKMWIGLVITGVDGFVTNQTDVSLILRVADCVPVVIFDPEHLVLGIFHAGWKGTVAQIHLKGLERRISDYQSDPKKCLVWLGPCLHSCCFRISDKPQQEADPQWKPFLKKSGSFWKIDLVGYLSSTLSDAGILKKNLHLDSRCTATDSHLFSHCRSEAKDQPEGRQLVIAKINP